MMANLNWLTNLDFNSASMAELYLVSTVSVLPARYQQ